MKALQSPLASTILRTTAIPHEHGSLFTYADKEYTIVVVPGPRKKAKEGWWSKVKGFIWSKM